MEWVELISARNDIKKVQALVGDITKEDLRHVDYYVSDNLGIFIPSVGFCQYAIRPQHIHPAYSFVLFFSAEQSIVEVKTETRPEHYLVTAMSPDVPHEEGQADDFTRYIAILISRELYETIYEVYSQRLPGKYEWDQFLVPQEFMFLLKKFMAEYGNRLPGYEQVLEALAVPITHQLIRNFLKIDVSPEFTTERFEIARVIEYMHQNYGQKLSVRKLAGIVNMSESHFTRTFKKETGVAPMEYLIGVRLEKAKKLLRAGTMNITEISLNCGFNSISHFSSSFAKHLDITPSEYQNSYTQQ
jgi:AraC-like DNA-binding protein